MALTLAGPARARARSSTRTPRSAWPPPARPTPTTFPVVTLATAHPAKFRDPVERATGHPPAPARADRGPVRPRGALCHAPGRSRARSRPLSPSGRLATDDRPRCSAAHPLPTACPSRPPMPQVETLAVALHADAGSRPSRRGLNGLAHLFEHMVFKGAGARARGDRRGDRGCRRGCSTPGPRATCTVFHARLLTDDLALGVELIADLIREPIFDADELEREKSVVLQELGEARDTPDDIIFDHLQSAAFPGQALGAPCSATRQHRRDRRRRPARVARAAVRAGPRIVAAGKVDEAALVELAEARFGDLARGRAARPTRRRSPAAPSRSPRAPTRRTSRSAYPGPGHADRDFYAAAALPTAAGGGMSSRLFQELREERGLAYSVYAWTTALRRHRPVLRLFRRRQAPTRRTPRAGSRGARRHRRDAERAELARAKAQAKAGLLMGARGVAGAGRLSRAPDARSTAGVVPSPSRSRAIDAVTLDAGPRRRRSDARRAAGARHCRRQARRRPR